MHVIDYFGLLCAALATVAMASLVYAGMVTTHAGMVTKDKEGLTSLDVDMLAVTAIATFVSIMVARDPGWLS